MAKVSFSDRIADLFQRNEWETARRLLEVERKKDPDNHWLLTQLGVTWYEQRRYGRALGLFASSLEIVPDCPLTLWNLAGTLDALGKPAAAARVYTWLIEQPPGDDPCWEGKDWADALKADCTYRLGVCFEHLGKPQRAERCFRQYLNLLMAGIDGTYPAENVMLRVRALHANGKQNGSRVEWEAARGRRTTPRKLDIAKLLAAVE